MIGIKYYFVYCTKMIQNRFKKILVPLDGSPNSIRGLNEAIALARQSQGTITGIHVLPKFPKVHSKMTKPLREQLTKNAQIYLKKAQTSAAKNGIELTGKILRSDKIVDTIIGFSKKYKFDIIVIGSRGMSAPHAAYLGSIANGVVNTSKIPVLVVH